MSERGAGRVPERVRRLADEREAARRARDFAEADALRDRIRDAGFEVTDTAEGPVLAPRAPAVPPITGPERVESLLDRPASLDASVHWIVEGWPEDVIRGVAAFRRHHPAASVQHVVVDVTGGHGPWPEAVDLVRLPEWTGWAAGRNAGLTRSLGRLVLVADGSVEVLGPVLDPIAAALSEPGVGITGPFGVVTRDLREFSDAEGPEVDAVEGYLMAFRRELLERGVRFDRRFAFYRTADLDLSFRVKDLGLRATVTPLPVARHEHRMWAGTAPDVRDRLSKRNFYRFLDRWRDRIDLTVAGSRRG